MGTSGMTMNGMSTGAGHGHGAGMTMGGVTFPPSSAGTNILPNWLAVLWTLVFLAVLVIHTRHVIDSRGQRRVWHSGHVLMAAGMVFMFAPAALDHFNIPSGFWSLLFASVALGVLAWILANVVEGRGVNMLWMITAVDMGAMAYMWSPAGFVAPITWLLVAYFLAQTALWATDRFRALDERQLFGSLRVGGGGTLTASAVEPLVCERDLRASLGVMTLGMAYMLAAMQLMM